MPPQLGWRPARECNAEKICFCAKILVDSEQRGVYGYWRIISNTSTSLSGKPVLTAEERSRSIEAAFMGVAENGECSLADLAVFLGVTEQTVRRHLTENGTFNVDRGVVRMIG